MKTITIVITFFGALICTLSSSAQIKIVKLENILETQSKENDTLYILNFWATWCKPCVAEMPYFEQISKDYKNQKVKVLFISLNYKKEMTSINQLLRNKDIKSECWLLDEPNPNKYVDKINPKWEGSIPATIFTQNNKLKYRFEEKEFSYEELKTIIQGW